MKFAGGGQWQAMHGEMAGYFEARTRGPRKRLYRLFCLSTAHLELRPMPAAAAATLRDDRDAAAGLLGATLPPAWPLSDLLDVLLLQAATDPGKREFRNLVKALLRSLPWSAP